MTNIKKSGRSKIATRPSFTKGFQTMSTALKIDTMSVLETVLKKTEKMLGYLEKEARRIKTEQQQKPSPTKRKRSPQKAKKKQKAR